MGADAADLARRLSERAEAVCRRISRNGRREGRYWLVGDVRNTPGRSMFVRLSGSGSGKGAAGKWTDAATGEHGDLLDVIRESCGLSDFGQVTAEARAFLGMPHPEPQTRARRSRSPASPARRKRHGGSSRCRGRSPARRWKPICLARSITALHETGSLRFHPRCYYRADDGTQRANSGRQ